MHVERELEEMPSEVIPVSRRWGALLSFEDLFEVYRKRLIRGEIIPGAAQVLCVACVGGV